MTDNSSAEKAALNKVWPKGLQLLCHFHILQAEWRWLTSAKNNVDKDERRKLISAFQRVLYAHSEEELDAATANLQSQSHPGYTARVEAMLERKEEWVLLFRNTITIRGHNTNNFAEASIRILKDIILNRTKAFNAVALADFVATVWEKYFEGRILKHAYSRVAAHQLQYHHLVSRMPDSAADNIVLLDDHLYNVPSSKQDGTSYEVWAKTGVCSCPSGRQGAFCKHQAVVHMRYGGLFPNAPVLTSEDRYELGRLALGEKCPPYEFFCSFQDSVDHFQPECPIVHERESDPCAPPSPDPLPSTSGFNEPESVHLGTESNLQAIQSELQRLSTLVGHNDTFEKCLGKIASQLSHIKTGCGAVGAAITISAALVNHARKGGKIRVQPTAIARRRGGVTRGSKRIPAGRPPKEPARKRAKKLGHTISSSIRKNVPHAKQHGQGH
ncbi:uncharacterized protein LOC135365803 [Ornithodoros turicata]|uniref:uncharacterized protein LOC135365803 n=1 Tax=Ornithodoros turicata TaxID=34597 RepID=UPI003138A97C